MPKDEHANLKAHMLAFTNSRKLAEKAMQHLENGEISKARKVFQQAEKWLAKAEGIEKKMKGRFIRIGN